MDDHAPAADNVFGQTEDEKLLIFIVSDEALEKAAGGTPWPPAHPGTGVATICVRGPSKL
jgi:hypothetical protein